MEASRHHRITEQDNNQGGSDTDDSFVSVSRQPAAAETAAEATATGSAPALDTRLPETTSASAQKDTNIGAPMPAAGETADVLYLAGVSCRGLPAVDPTLQCALKFCCQRGICPKVFKVHFFKQRWHLAHCGLPQGAVEPWCTGLSGD
jgi:hypothetical protein